MKIAIILLALITSTYMFNMSAQTTQDFLNNCFDEEKNKGATGIIFCASLCSVCMTEPTFEGYMFIQEASGSYRFRYLKYINKYNSVKVLDDKTYIDENLKGIFKLVQTYQDSIFYQVSNIEGLLTDTVLINGKKTYDVIGKHGKLRHLRLYYEGKSESSFHLIISLNGVHERAYHYWLLYSYANNYVSDFVHPRINYKK